MGRLEGKSVIITGAGSGIGRAASILFAKEGAKLVIVDRAEGVKETAKLVSDAGGSVEAVMADAGSEADVKAFEAELKKRNPVDEFILYAGAPHAFFSDDRPQVYKKEAAEDAWKRCVAFFDKYLKG